MTKSGIGGRTPPAKLERSISSPTRRRNTHRPDS